MTNDNRQTEMLESEIMFSLLKKFLEVEFFFPERCIKIRTAVFFKIWVFKYNSKNQYFPSIKINRRM